MPDLLSGFGLSALVAVFVLSASAVAGAGIVLARGRGAIAERTGLGGLIVGMLLLAGATSLQENALRTFDDAGVSTRVFGAVEPRQ